jgi:hypothetical protein
VPGLDHGEFDVGATTDHDRRRTMTASDSRRFCDTTSGQMLHLDVAFAAETRFGERGAVQMYVDVYRVGPDGGDTLGWTLERTVLALRRD